MNYPFKSMCEDLNKTSLCSTYSLKVRIHGDYYGNSIGFMGIQLGNDNCSHFPNLILLIYYGYEPLLIESKESW